MGKATYRLRSKDDCMHEMWIINKKSRKKIVENYLKGIKEFLYVMVIIEFKQC